ncbi:MAG TPA: hypothetical protein VIU34_28540 [Steroidobacter sp.]
MAATPAGQRRLNLRRNRASIGKGLAIGDFVAARDFLHDDRAMRPAILAVVIGAHLAAFFIPLVERLEPIHDWPRLGVIFLISAPPHEKPLSPTLDRAPLAKVYADSWQLPDPAPLDLPSESAPTGSAMAPPDWKQSGADAAADAARKEYRALGPRAEEPKIKMPRSPFKQQPPEHKFGDVGEDVQENPVAWLSDKCYVLLENRKARPDDPIANIPMTLCNFRGSKARGDLFEHLRKPQPPP